MGSHWQSGAIERSAGSAASVEDLALSCPEEIFLSWLLWLPQGSDIRTAAAREVARLDRRAPLPDDLRRLRALLITAAEGAAS
ncbi:hypothetical protein [Mesorhizobium sp. YR577]|jgi:hypothetical protein|uniref:hypothetical protein n=1 Tax=Mesorhizobium sp. YR577 TaxID=1884373 RepID=UPI0008F2F192|nr:hypothetical protein [Mesorhizobium sp. YR577]SFU12913.1 hypothetical protein SAMN05518861_11482 [Mesorhizobium sp. YR577]